MLEYIAQEASRTQTENGAAAYTSTGSHCLDLFATIGALRHADEAEIIRRFVPAYTEDALTAMKILFFARDVRGGLGERKVFRTVMNWLAQNHPHSVKNNIQHIAHYGRFDDLLSLYGTQCHRDMLEVITSQLAQDVTAMKQGKEVSLLAKWLPSVNTSSADTVAMAKGIAKAMGYSQMEYRKTLAQLRRHIRILENNLREKDYTFDYEKQPSRALYKYRRAFIRNDGQRYGQFISDAQSGRAKLNAANVAPYELVEPYLDGGWFYGSRSFMKHITPQQRAVLNATWDALPDFGSDENAIAVIDTSGSMYCCAHPMPAAVALSLGLYFAQHNRGIFHNHFIEFSARPQLISIKGSTFADRLQYVTSFNEVANTNLEAVFDLILSAAVRNRVTQDQLPARIVIVSDMEFDSCVDNASLTVFDSARQKFAAQGYTLPQVVFWNVASRTGHQPVRMNQQGVALVSGVTPRLFGMVASGTLSPYTFMMEVITSDRYAPIAA